MPTSTITILRIRGIDVRVEPSSALIALLVAYSFWDRFTSGTGRHSVGAAFVMAVAATVIFFASILAHEVAHALEAVHRGVSVGSITLYVFGGATETTSEPKRPIDEFALTAIGPYISLVLAAGFGLIAYAADRGGLTEVSEIFGVL